MDSPEPRQGPSLLLNYLPAMYVERDFGEEARAHEDFLGSFLLAFEEILLGRSHGKEPEETVSHHGLEEIIARIHTLFDPQYTPDEFLPWLAGWAALSFPPGLANSRKRRLIAQIIPLYEIRGTKKYLQRLLALCLGGTPQVDDEGLPAMQVGVHSTLGADTYVGGGAPHFFRVVLPLPHKESLHLEEELGLAHDVIQRAKPAHTAYELEIVFPRMQIGVHSTVGFDTILEA